MKIFSNKWMLFLLLTLFLFVSFLSAQDSSGENVYDDQMDPDLNETPIEYRTLEDLESNENIDLGGSDGSSDLGNSYDGIVGGSSSGSVDLGETSTSDDYVADYGSKTDANDLSRIISEKLMKWERDYRISIPKNSKVKIVKKTLKLLLNDGDYSEKSIEDKLESTILREIINLVLDRLDDYKVDLSDKSRENITTNVLRRLLKKDFNDLNTEVDRSLRNELRDIIDELVKENLRELGKDMDDSSRDRIIFLVINNMNSNDDEISNDSIKKSVDKAVKKYDNTGVSPDSGEKIHIVIKGDNLYDLSYKYYDKEDRARGAHWVHIYDYSVRKGYINPKTQPIRPKDQYKYFVRLNVGQKVAIPYMNGKYPPVEDILNKYGYTMKKNGKIENIQTNIPINIQIENK